MDRDTMRRRVAISYAVALVLCVLLYLVASPGGANAQVDTVQHETLSSAHETELVMGYRQMLARYSQLVPVASEPRDSNKEITDPQHRLEIDGLVVDETRTKVGRDFYDVFYTTWQAPEEAFNFTVTVKERPSPGRGTIVFIDVNGEVAFQARLQPKYEVIEATARQAIYYVHRKLRSTMSSVPAY